MDLRDRLIIEEYRKTEPTFKEIGEIVHAKLRSLIRTTGRRVFTVQHRVKKEKSLAGKLVRHAGRYSQLLDLTDILGARVVCYFNDDVKAFGELIEQEFVVDASKSGDKRNILNDDSFGYLSLHYICYLPPSDEYPAEYCEWPFEIQVRTCLQHVWSDIEHDLGYKTEFGMPSSVARGFARISALLELADDEFMRVRDVMVDYTESVRRSIIDGTADDVHIDNVSLSEYVRHNKSMRAMLDRMAQSCCGQIEECEPGAYVEQLAWLGITTMGGLSSLLGDNEEMALRMFELALTATDLDIISSSTGLRYLCQAEVCRRGMPVEAVADFLNISLGNPERARARAERLLKTYERLVD